MRLTDEQVKALIEWADEGDRDNGTTAWGQKFTAAMEVAQHVRDNGHRCDGCNDILGAKYRQDIPKKGDLCPTCYEEWMNDDTVTT